LKIPARLVALGAMLLLCGLPSAAKPSSCIWSGVERVVAIGDLHGDYGHFVRILRSPKVRLIDEDLHWTGGRTHLVQIGDVMDRGDHAKEIFDLLMRLEKEAAAAGGMVHVLLGNHEEANMTGIALGYPDYVQVDQFYAFLPASFKKAGQKTYLAQLPPEERALAKDRGLDFRDDPGWRGYWENVLRETKQAKGLDEAGLAYTKNFNDTYGKWLLGRNVVIKINDVVYVHAGINLKYSTWKLESINDLYRIELRIFALRQFRQPPAGLAAEPKMIYAPDSPLRIRQDEENTTPEQMDQILANLGARRMVVGHNFLRTGDSRSPIVPAGDVDPLFGGKVWMIDTGIWSTAYGGRLYALIVEGDRFDHYTEPGEPVPPRIEAPLTNEGPEGPEDIEAFLRDARPVFVLPGEAGRTDPWKVRLERRGVERWAQFKYIDRPRPAAIPDSYRYELAAYALAEHLGLGLVPPVVERGINDYLGSLQIFVDDAIRESEVKRRDVVLDDPEGHDRALADLRVFINLAADRCDAERDRDILVQKGTGQVFAVDFSQAFEPRTGMTPGCDITRCSRALYERIRRWDRDAVDLLLDRYLDKGELVALHARAAAVLTAIRDRIHLKGEAAVLF
jgi:hypothetical protein